MSAPPAFKFVRPQKGGGYRRRRTRMPPAWLECVRRQATCVWFWIPGYATGNRWCGVLQTDESTVLAVEKQIKRYMGLPPGRVAFALFQPAEGMLNSSRRWFEYERGDERYTRGVSDLRLARWLDRETRRIRRAVPHVTIGLLMEDFTCRSIRHMRRPPDYLILDTPMLSYAELAAARDKYDRPGVLRRSPFYRLTPWVWRYRWRMRFPLEQWCCQHLEVGRDPIGVWRPYSERQPMWVESVANELENRI